MIQRKPSKIVVTIVKAVNQLKIKLSRERRVIKGILERALKAEVMI